MRQTGIGRPITKALFLGICALLCCFVVTERAWASDPDTISRFAGLRAADTAIESSKAAFPDGSEYVVLARQDDYMDSMSATGLAGALDAPILLTDRKHLSTQTADEIERLGASKVYLIGGEIAVKPAVARELEALGVTVQRIWGNDACDTSVKCARMIESVDGGRNELDMVIVATSIDFADALSVSSFAYKYHLPIFITTAKTAKDGDRVLRADAQAVINGYESIFIPGGPGAIPLSSVEGIWGDVEDGGKCTRVYGYTGYDTSVAVAEKLINEGYLTGDTIGIATGIASAKGLDALTSSALLAQKDAPLVLVERTVNTSAAGAFIGDYSDHFNEAYVFGGTYVCPEPLMVEIDKLLRGVVHYVAVIGSDYWTSSTSTFHLQASDLMMLMRVDTEDAVVSYYTIPRDTYYVIRDEEFSRALYGKTCTCPSNSSSKGLYGFDPCNGKTWYKANYAFHYGYYQAKEAGLNHEQATAVGAEKTCQAISQIAQLGVRDYVLCDLVTFQEIVDTFNGGIEMSLPYPIQYSFYDKSYASVSLKSGSQELDGFNAMVAARSRVSYENDLGLSGDATRQIVNRSMLHTLINYALHSEWLGQGSTGELLQAFVDAGLVQTNIAPSDVIAWGDALQAKRSDVKMYASSGPVKGKTRTYYNLGTNTPQLSPGDANYENGFKQFIVEYDKDAYLNLSEELCSGGAMTGVNSAKW